MRSDCHLLEYMNQIAEQTIAAYGGKELWTNAQTIHAEVSVHGWAFTLKQRPFFKHAQISMAVARPCSRLTPTGKNPHVAGVLDGHDVRLEDQNGAIIAECKDVRSYWA